MSTMSYFEVKERLENLTEFRNLYADYASFTNKPNNVPAQMVRQKMEPLVPMTVDSLRRVGLGHMVTHDAPVRGGRKVRINRFRHSEVQAAPLDSETSIVQPVVLVVPLRAVHGKTPHSRFQTGWV
jgi:hypothetical protein